MLGTFLAVLFCVVCILLIVVILLQRGRGGGLSGAFGGAGGQTPFGAKTGDVFTWITVGLTATYLTLTIVLNFVMEPKQYSVPISADTPPISAPADNQSVAPPTDDAQDPPQQQQQPD